jgi:hypothetical protein
MTDLPDFPYHPDPITTGFVEASDTECIGCGKARGFIYTGPVYAVDELVEVICPWCIADGTAATKLDAEFTDVGWACPTGCLRKSPRRSRDDLPASAAGSRSTGSTTATMAPPSSAAQEARSSNTTPTQSRCSGAKAKKVDGTLIRSPAISARSTRTARRRRICSVADTAAPTSRTPISASWLSRS